MTLEIVKRSVETELMTFTLVLSTIDDEGERASERDKTGEKSYNFQAQRWLRAFFDFHHWNMLNRMSWKKINEPYDNISHFSNDNESFILRRRHIRFVIQFLCVCERRTRVRVCRKHFSMDVFDFKIQVENYLSSPSAGDRLQFLCFCVFVKFSLCFLLCLARQASLAIFSWFSRIEW